MGPRPPGEGTEFPDMRRVWGRLPPLETVPLGAQHSRSCSVSRAKDSAVASQQPPSGSLAQQAWA